MIMFMFMILFMIMFLMKIFEIKMIGCDGVVREEYVWSGGRVMGWSGGRGICIW